MCWGGESGEGSRGPTSTCEACLIQPPRVELCTEYVMKLALAGKRWSVRPSGDQPGPPVRSCPSIPPPQINIPISYFAALSPNGVLKRAAAAECPAPGRGRRLEIACLAMC